MKWILPSTIMMLLCLLVTGMAIGGVLALYYSDLGPAALRTILAAVFSLFALAALAGLALRRWRRRALGAFAIIFTATRPGPDPAREIHR